MGRNILTLGFAAVIATTLPSLAQVSGGAAPVTTDAVMAALPVGTVLLFDKAVPSHAPSGWAPCGYSGFVRLEQASPGTAYAGQSATISGTTGQATGDTNWNVNSNQNPPEANGIHHVHSFSANLAAGAYMPPGQNFACLHKVQ